jgi:hypothetical protein
MNSKMKTKGSKTYHREVWRKLGYNSVRLSPSEFLAINKAISIGFQNDWTADMCAATIFRNMKEEKVA